MLRECWYDRAYCHSKLTRSCQFSTLWLYQFYITVYSVRACYVEGTGHIDPVILFISKHLSVSFLMPQNVHKSADCYILKELWRIVVRLVLVSRIVPNCPLITTLTQINIQRHQASPYPMLHSPIPHTTCRTQRNKQINK